MTTEIYVEVFYDVCGRPWYRAVHVPTRREAVAATADQAVQALLIRLQWESGAGSPERPQSR